MLTSLNKFKEQIKIYKKLGLNERPFQYFFKWRKSLKNGANSIDDQLPWITFDAIKYLQKFLTPKSIVFEFGGGGSTLFFLKNQATVYTVEHDANWFKKLEEIVKEKKYNKWFGFFIEGEKEQIINNPDIANPLHYATEDEFYRSYNFKNYSLKISEFENEFFDIVLIDGRSRPSCIHHSLDKIKRNGILVLDNSDRTYYLEQMRIEIEKKFTLVLSKYSPSPYSYDFTHTSIWIKNK
jgi:hypothetical protein